MSVRVDPLTRSSRNDTDHRSGSLAGLPASSVPVGLARGRAHRVTRLLDDVDVLVLSPRSTRECVVAQRGVMTQLGDASNGCACWRHRPWRPCGDAGRVGHCRQRGAAWLPGGPVPPDFGGPVREQDVLADVPGCACRVGPHRRLAGVAPVHESRDQPLRLGNRGGRVRRVRPVVRAHPGARRPGDDRVQRGRGVPSLVGPCVVVRPVEVRARAVGDVLAFHEGT